VEKDLILNTAELEALFPDPYIRGIISAVEKNEPSIKPNHACDFAGWDAEGKKMFEKTNVVCFAQLPELCFDNKTIKYITYKPRETATKEETIRWIQLGQDVGVLTDTEEAAVIAERGVKINVQDPNLTIGNLYMQLAYMRSLYEYISLVRNVIKLVDKAGRDFWAALMFCHYNHGTDTNHCLLPFNKSPYSKSEKDRDLGLALQLYNTCNNPLLVDKMTVISATKRGDWSWGWHRKILNFNKSFVVKNRWMLLSSEVYPIITCGSFDKAESMVNELKKGNSNVKFV
jgi:hypothetical protein